MRGRSIALGLALGVLALGPVAADYTVREIGSFYIGGRTETLAGLPMREITFSPGSPPIKSDPNGEFAVEQMYVQFVKLAKPRNPLPILLWHGGGLTGVTWETKPDGKPGWQQFFLNAGFDTYVSDSVERGRASWARYPEIFKSEPFFRAKKEGWELFRLGPSYEKREAFPGVKFPVANYDDFAKQAVPRWSTNDVATQKAYDALVQKVCPCIVIVHSQGGNFGFAAALHAPDKVKALIALEPSGNPDPDKNDLKVLKDVPHLIVWGDNRDKVPVWEKISAGPNKYKDALIAAGVKVDVIDLPKIGLHGNTHMMMMDTNSDEIAKLVQLWLVKNKLAK